jgi:hypothetical protein
MKLLIILYTLCNTPQYLTVLDQETIGVFPYTPETIIYISKEYKDLSIDEITNISLPLDDVDNRSCV